jgi:hypothetical protein
MEISVGFLAIWISTSQFELEEVEKSSILVVLGV